MATEDTRGNDIENEISDVDEDVDSDGWPSARARPHSVEGWAHFGTRFKNKLH